MLRDKLKAFMKASKVTSKSVAQRIGITTTSFQAKMTLNRFNMRDFLTIADMCNARVFMISKDGTFKVEFTIDDIKETE